MAIKNEQAKATIYLDGKQAESALKGLENRAKDLRDALKAAQAAGDQVKMKKIQSELTGVESATRSLRKETFDYQKVLKNLNGASISDIRKAMRTLEIQMNKMSRTDPGYLKAAAELKLLKAELYSVNGVMRANQSGLSRLADGFNKYFTIVGAAVASFAGVAMTVKSTVQAYAEFDDKLADVQKTTGLTKSAVIELSDELKKMDTRTSQLELLDLARVAGKLGISAKEDILGFVRAADQIRVALTQDLGGDVEESVNQIGKLVDIFKIKNEFGIEQAMIKVGSAINALGAASTANEGYLVEFGKRVAGIAPTAGFTIQQVLGLGATLDQLGQTAEVSGTVFNQVVGNMFKDQAAYAKLAGMAVSDFSRILDSDANEAFIRVLMGLKGNNSAFAEMAQRLDGLGLDGTRVTSVLGVLANNVDILRQSQALSNIEFDKGTSLLAEFNTKNDTAQGKIDKAKKSFAQMQVELGQRLAPAYTSIISKSTLLIRALGLIVEFAFKHGKAILMAASAIAGYTVAVKIAAATDGAWVLVKKVLTGQITLATIAQRGFNLAVKANPIGLLVAALAAGVTWLIAWNQKTGRFNDDLRKMGDNLRDLANWFINLYNNSLVVRAGFEEMLAVWKTSFTVISAVLQNLWEQLKLTGKVIEAILTLDFSNLKQAFIDYGNNVSASVIASAKEIGATWAGAYNKTVSGKMAPIQQKVVMSAEFIGPEEYIAPGQKTKGKKTAAPKLTPEQEEAASKLAEEEAEKAQKEQEKILKKAREVLETARNDELAKLKQQLLDKQITKKQAQDEELLLEISHLTALKALNEKYGQDVSDINNKIIDKKLEIQKAADEMLEVSVEVEKSTKEQQIKDEEQFLDEIDKYQKDFEKESSDRTQREIEDNLAKQETIEKLREAQVRSAVEAGAAAVENAESVAEAGKAVLNSIRQQLRAYLAEAVATAALKALKSVPFPLNIIAATVAGGAATFLFNKLIPKFESGGYTTPGSKDKPAGIVHAGEWVAPQRLVQSPVTAPVIHWLERVRASGASGTINIPSGSYASGGIVRGNVFSPASGSAVGGMPEGQGDQGLSEDTASRLITAIEAFTKKQLVVDVETIEKRMQTLDSIRKNRGL